MKIYYQAPNGYCGIPDAEYAIVRNRGPGKYEVGAQFYGDPDGRWHWCSIQANSKAGAMKKAEAVYLILRANAAARMQAKAAELTLATRKLLEVE